MKKAAKVFLVIGLICGIIVLISAIYAELGTFNIIYGIYSIIISIACLISLNGGSKTAVVVWGIFYIPVMLLASIFMFCTPKEDLY